MHDLPQSRGAFHRGLGVEKFVSKQVPYDHTGQIITQGLPDALASWKSKVDKQVCITTDNESNVIKAVGLN